MSRPVGLALVHRLEEVRELARRQYEAASRAARPGRAWRTDPASARAWAALDQLLACSLDLWRARREMEVDA